jgi:hypothetical protein
MNRMIYAVAALLVLSTLACGLGRSVFEPKATVSLIILSSG